MLEAKEVQATARKEDRNGNQAGLSTTRKEMITAIQKEEDEAWEELQFFNVAVCCQSALVSFRISYRSTLVGGGRENIRHDVFYERRSTAV